jgi:3-deoxy-D-manno-octulosonate 8-phosphate phosphatase (KDO 8-P phosphatase)
MAENYKNLLGSIDTFIFDVDGVFTGNVVLLMPDGEQVRTANVRDGYAVQLAVKKGYRIAIISGGKSEAVRRRFEGLGVTDVYLGASDKVKVFREYAETKGIDTSKTVYMGDDIPDWKVMHLVGLAACPADAVPEIKSFCRYISPRNGGEGCVRDIIEQTLRAQGRWFDEESHHW